MGDMRVITASERHSLYKANNCAMRFKMRVPLPGLGPAMTFVAKDNPALELYKIIIGRLTNVVDRTSAEQEVTTFPLHHIDLQNFQEFWVTWYNNKIRMGLAGEEKPFLVYTMRSGLKIGYVQFNTVSRNWAPIEWVIETSPVILKKLPVKHFDDELRWVPMQNGRLPPDAMIGGFENELTYIARAFHNGSLSPGKYVPSSGLAYVPWGHREHSKREFEILCGHNAQWVQTKLHCIPINAFVGGQSEVRNEPLYIGRAMHDGKLLIGKVHVLYKTCYLPYNGKEVEVTEYEILVIPQKAVKQAIHIK